jgi:hypothetical protein
MVQDIIIRGIKEEKEKDIMLYLTAEHGMFASEF